MNKTELVSQLTVPGTTPPDYWDQNLSKKKSKNIEVDLVKALHGQEDALAIALVDPGRAEDLLFR